MEAAETPLRLSAGPLGVADLYHASGARSIRSQRGETVPGWGRKRIPAHTPRCCGVGDEQDHGLPCDTTRTAHDGRRDPSHANLLVSSALRCLEDCTGCRALSD